VKVTITLVLDDQHQVDAVTAAFKDGGKGIRALVTDMYRKGTNDTDIATFARLKASIAVLDAVGARYADAIKSR
jgi:D-serine deaminase-like pyridoxal phosphate-dependent protein